ncbi:MtN3 and saliva related transmembrane protein [Cyclonatronum proteinivorum]|uniref:MtN3 and saliva related transmembrane protein n=1 Tax=Cyclonatronum proteinivorum TaxID=1457365 RepID=A0A345UP44_9BACT|nr:SemiSWEET transporter [Cyclonatronum proteinivorum]AXJ02246.1 MtN3 and saliva related transmembrane protein [Cyclonatronum proteinivorum]
MEISPVTVIGLLAASCTTISFLPQVLKTWKSKSAKDLSWGMFSIFATGVFLWLVYGLMISDLPIILANAVTLLLVLTILYFKFTFDRDEPAAN